MEEFKPYFGVMATNSFEKDIINDIDIAAIYVKNRDPNEYQDKIQMEQERLRFLSKKQMIPDSDS